MKGNLMESSIDLFSNVELKHMMHRDMLEWNPESIQKTAIYIASKWRENLQEIHVMREEFDKLVYEFEQLKKEMHQLKSKEHNIKIYSVETFPYQEYDSDIKSKCKESLLHSLENSKESINPVKFAEEKDFEIELVFLCVKELRDEGIIEDVK